MSLVQKLYLKLLWLRCSYSFRWAHKPLCDRFSGDVLGVANMYLCRSCFCLYAGSLLTLILLFSPMLSTTFAKSVFLYSYLPTLLLSGPWVYKRLPRIIRDLLRLSLGIGLTLWGFLLLQGYLMLCTVSAIPAVLGYIYYFRKRKIRKKLDCKGCAEFGEDTICSGFALQAEGARLYEDRATEYLLATGYMPPSIKGK